MRALTIARRELDAYFLSPISYVVATLFLLVEGYLFWLVLSYLNGCGAAHGAVLQYFFGGAFYYWLMVMFLVAIITMRLVAEEERLGTLEPLLTAPVDEWEIVLGKYLGALVFWVTLWAPTLVYVLLLAHYAPPDGALDLGPVCSGYLGTLLIGASALSLGLFFSTLTRNQIIAAVLCFTTLALLLFVGALSDMLIRFGPIGALLRHIDLVRHMEDFGRGIVDSRTVVYHLSLAGFGLFAATRTLAARRAQ